MLFVAFCFALQICVACIYTCMSFEEQAFFTHCVTPAYIVQLSFVVRPLKVLLFHDARFCLFVINPAGPSATLRISRQSSNPLIVMLCVPCQEHCSKQKAVTLVRGECVLVGLCWCVSVHTLTLSS